MRKILNLKNKKMILIIGLSVILAIGLGVGGYFLFRPAKKSTQDWLNDFSSSISSFSSLKKQIDTNIRFERKMQIFENNVVVASFFQSVQISHQDEGVVAKLIVEERYPTSESNEFNTYDEYWLVGDKMYTIRYALDNKLISSFPSSIDIFVQLTNGNIGGAKYNFDEHNFETLSIVETQEFHKLTATVVNDKVKSFIGDSDMFDISQAEVHVDMNKKLELKSFDLTYQNEDGKSNKITLNVLEHQTILFDDWIKELL